MLNSELLSSLIRKAMGDRPMSQFADECNISKGNLSKILNNKTNQAPTFDTLMKIADNSQNSVTYNDLLFAAGYIKEVPENETNIDVAKKINELRLSLLNNRENVVLNGEHLSEEALESLLEALSFGIKQASIYNRFEKKNKNNP